MNMTTSRRMSVINIEMIVVLVRSTSGVLQIPSNGIHEERICGRISPEDPKYSEIDSSPEWHLVTNHV
jgi:hypothetical protein